MALSLSCSCGAHFDVEDTFAGQAVSCPECQASIQAPALQRGPVRTSGWAVASVVIALVLACTGVGTVAAVLLGALALVQIARSRGRLAGTGFALFGIAAGLVFSGVFLLIVLRGELFGVTTVREYILGKEVDHGGPLEVVRKSEGFAITRPSQRWGIARTKGKAKTAELEAFMLADLVRDAYIDVSFDQAGGRTLETYRDDVIAPGYRDHSGKENGRREFGMRRSNLQIRQRTRVSPGAGLEAVDLLLDVHLEGQRATFLIRVLREIGSDQLFIIRGWTTTRRFGSLEPEIRQALDSFRILKEE
jgi:hypothetical protein